MANMLHKSAPYLLNMRCPCPKCVSGPDRRIERRVARRREERAWRRDHEAGYAEAHNGWGLFIDGDYDEPYIHFGEWASNPHRDPWAGAES